MNTNYKQEAMEMFNDLVDRGFSLQSAADEVLFNYDVEDTPPHLLQYVTPYSELDAAFNTMLENATLAIKK